MAIALSARRADICDIDAIIGINRRALGYDYPPDRARNQLAALLERDDVGIFVCGVPAVGYVHACEYLCGYAPPLANIMAMAVLPEAQHTGVGRALMKSAEDWALSRNLAGVRLTSGCDRHGAHEFYKAVGYTDRKDQKNFVKYFG